MGYNCTWMATLYDIISELRREHPTPAAARTLDLVVAALGESRDNLKKALHLLDDRTVPDEGKAVLEELRTRAFAEGVEDYEVPLTPDELKAAAERVDKAQVGIAVLLGGTALVVTVLAVGAFVAGLAQILRSTS